MRQEDLRHLRCPITEAELEFEGELDRGHMAEGELVSRTDPPVRWPVQRGLPRLMDPALLRGSDALMRRVYDVMAPVHDAGVDLVLPVLQWGSVAEGRRRYLARLRLDELRRGDRPLRILDVGIGAGGNAGVLFQHLSPSLDVELWGVDISARMLGLCRRRVRRGGHVERLAQADAHALPFADATFDRVLHVGAAGTWHDPRTALDEMARVAMPGTPVVVVDEQLDPERGQTPWFRAAFRGLTAGVGRTRAPADLVPPGAREVEVTQVSRFYYCLSFTTPA